MSVFKCPKCEGSGLCELPKKLQESAEVIKTQFSRGSFLVSDFQEAFNLIGDADSKALNLDTAHHRVKRLVKLGFLRKIPSSSPSRYMIVAPKKAML